MLPALPVLPEKQLESDGCSVGSLLNLVTSTLLTGEKCAASRLIAFSCHKFLFTEDLPGLCARKGKGRGAEAMKGRE